MNRHAQLLMSNFQGSRWGKPLACRRTLVRLGSASPNYPRLKGGDRSSCLKPQVPWCKVHLAADFSPPKPKHDLPKRPMREK